MTGQPLKWEVVSGAQARAEGHPTADLDTEWLKVHLARPVPKGGEGRVLIDKTYKDAKSYFRDGDTHRVRPLARHPPQRGGAAARLSPDQLQRAVAGHDDTGRARHDHVPEHQRGRGAAGDSRRSRAWRRSRRRFRRRRGHGHDRDAGIAGVAPVRSRASGSRDRLLPERSVDAFVQPVSRLHGVASRGRALLQHRPRRQHGVESVGGAARHRRGVEGRNDQRRGVEEARPRCRRTGRPIRRRSS